jgi:hypothetical protein
MPKSEDTPWKRLFAEGLAIVLSILLAFGIDAWWQGRQQKYAETVLLQAILDDLGKKKNLLAREKKYNQAILESASTLVNAAADTQRNLGEDDIDRLIAFTWWYHDPSVWDSAPMLSLIEGGDFSDITNPGLGQKLSELHLSLGKMKTVYANDQEFHNDVLIPFFIANVNLPQIANATKHVPGDPESGYVFPDFVVATQYNHLDLLSKVEFQSLLVAKIDKLVDMSGPLIELDKQLDESIEMIDGELAK